MKKIVSFLLMFLVILTFPVQVYANNTVNATYTNSQIYLDNKYVYISGFNIEDNNYFKLRDLAKLFDGTSSQFDVNWNSTANAIEITTNKAYSTAESNEDAFKYWYSAIKAIPCNSKIMVDGVQKSIKAYTINDSNYFRLRDLGELIPYEVDYDAASNSILLFSKPIENTYRINVNSQLHSNYMSSRFPRWSSSIDQYIYAESNGIINVVNVLGDSIQVNSYNTDYTLVKQKSIAYELPVFGAFYSGNEYNYIAFGQSNKEENDQKEVIRIVKYDKNFNIIDSASVFGGECYTTVPFDAACGRMAENDNTLIFHSSRERYTSSDGRNHQSQLTMIVNTDTMEVINDLGLFQENHVSHSFDQYVQFDDNSQVLIDHGDAYPRSVVLHKGDGHSSYSEVDLFDIPGAIGANYTGVSIGGFEISSSNYIVAINTIDHSRVTDYTSFEMVGLGRDQRDIVLCLVSKDNMYYDTVKHITIAKYVDTNKIASIPKLVKLSQDKLMVLWQEYSIDGSNTKLGNLKYVYIDGEGSMIGNINEKEHYLLSECQPIVLNNRVIWATNNNGIQTVYTIPIE